MFCRVLTESIYQQEINMATQKKQTDSFLPKIIDIYNKIKTGISNVATTALTPLEKNLEGNQDLQNVINSPAGQLIQGNYGNVLPAFQKRIADINANPENELSKVNFVGEMADIPTFGKLPAIPKKPPVILNAKGNPIKSANAIADVGSNPPIGNYILDKNKNLIPNLKPQEPVYSQELPTYPKTSTLQEKTQGINLEQPVEINKTPLKRPPSERTFSSDNFSKDDILTNQKRNIQIDGKDIKTPNEVNQIHATLNGYGIKGTPTQELQGASDQIGKLAKQTKQIISNEGGTVSKESLINQTQQNLSYGSNHNIPQSQLQASARNYINNVYVRAIGEDVTKGIAAPADIPGSVVADMKTIMNQDARSTFQQPDPTKWSINQQVSRYGRDATDTILDTQYPNASKLNNDMSDLYKAEDSLRKGANAESNIAQKEANIPPPSLGEKVGNLLHNPLVRYGATALGAGELVRGGQDIGNTLAIGGEAINDFSNFLPGRNQNIPNGVQNNKPNNETQHTQTISYQYPDVKPNPDGSWSWESKQQPGGSFMSEQQFIDATRGLTPGTPDYIKMQQRYEDSKANALNVLGRKGGKIYDFMNDARVGFTGSTNALKGIDGLSEVQGFYNAWKPGLDIKAYIQKADSPQSVVRAMQNLTRINDNFSNLYEDLNGELPDNSLLIQPGNSPEQMKGKLNAQANFIKGNYTQGGDYPGQFQDAYLVRSNATGTGNQSANQTAIQNPPSTTSDSGNLGFSHPNAESYLPQITK